VIFDLLGKEVEAIEKSAIKSSIILRTYLKSGSYLVQVNEIKGITLYKIVKE
jgi:hypothetical protein